MERQRWDFDNDFHDDFPTLAGEGMDEGLQGDVWLPSGTHTWTRIGVGGGCGGAAVDSGSMEADGPVSIWEGRRIGSRRRCGSPTDSNATVIEGIGGSEAEAQRKVGGGRKERSKWGGQHRGGVSSGRGRGGVRTKANA